jgi:hypothetical protein
MPIPTPEASTTAPTRPAGRVLFLWGAFFAALLAGIVLALRHVASVPVLLDFITR